MKPTLEEVKRRYPIGTRVWCAHLSKKEDQQFTVLDYEGISIDVDIVNLSSVRNPCSWSPCLYDNGKWAEIVNDKKGTDVPSRPTPISSAEDWCVEITEENREVVKKWMGDDSYSYSIGAKYGLKRGGKDASKVSWGIVLTTEEFYAKIGHVPVGSFKFKIGDKVRAKNPHWQSWDASLIGKCQFFSFEEFKITDRKFNDGENWYRDREDSNWYSEEGLELDITLPTPSNSQVPSSNMVEDPILTKSQKTSNNLELYHQSPVITKRKTSKNKLLTI